MKSATCAWSSPRAAALRAGRRVLLDRGGRGPGRGRRIRRRQVADRRGHHRPAGAAGRVAAGEILLGGRRIDNLPDEQMRRVRGREIGAVFQDPLTSLNPLYTVGRQLAETIVTHLDLSWSQARAGGRTAGGHRHPGGARAHRPLSAPVLRRHAPARGDRAGPGRRTAPGGGRRTHHRAGRVDPGADHRTAQAPVPRAGHGRHADHPRHGRDRRDRRPRRRDVRGPRGRDRPGGRRDPQAASPLHGRPDGLDSGAGQPRPAAGADRRQHAALERHPDGLCVQSALRPAAAALHAGSS